MSRSPAPPWTPALLGAALLFVGQPAGGTPPAKRSGPYAEAYAGLNLAGAVEGESSGEAGLGAAFGVRGGYRLLPYLALGAAVELATLPVEGLPSGNFSLFALEAVGIWPTEHVELHGGVALGYDSARGTYGDYSGFPGLRLRVGARVPIVDHFDLGLDYGLTMPQSDDEVVSDGRTWHVVPAWLHQVTVVAGVPFW